MKFLCFVILSTLAVESTFGWGWGCGNDCWKNSHCDNSHWCEGGSAAKCGKCISKAKDGAACYYASSCQTGQCTCRKCGNQLEIDDWCSTNANCKSGWCDGSVTMGCNGKYDILLAFSNLLDINQTIAGSKSILTWIFSLDFYVGSIQSH